MHQRHCNSLEEEEGALVKEVLAAGAAVSSGLSLCDMQPPNAQRQVPSVLLWKKQSLASHQPPGGKIIN